jgi:purine-nucleoside phosphorylase
MQEYLTLAEIQEAVDFILARSHYQPKIGVILGSGLGDLANAVEAPDVIPFNEIPHWPVSTVIGHSGKLLIGLLEDKPVLVMQGRVHYYEGYSIAQVTFPIRVMQRMGIQNLIVTNAAGAVNPDYLPGQLMLIKDHISLMAMAGQNPLRGPNLEEFGPRFPDMSQAYDRALLDLARRVAQTNQIPVQEGVYVCLAGPSFESPADLRFLRAIGADAVGMSTIPEVIVARHGGTHVLGISGLSNKANLDGNSLTTHEEVLEAGRQMVPSFVRIIRGVVREMA